MQRLLPLLLILMVLAACTNGTPTADVPTATFGPAMQSTATSALDATPTGEVIVEAPTEPAATATLSGMATAIPAAPTEVPPTSVPPTAVPPTATAASSGVVLTQPAPIWIQQPGPGSRLVSPVTVAGEAESTFEQNLVVRLVSMDGTELALVPTTIQGDLGARGTFSVNVPFTVSGETPATIQLFADSPRDGGIIRLASAGVTLLASGTNDIRPGPPNLERIEIQAPAFGSTVAGGSVVVSGIGLASFEQALTADLLDADGNTLARRPITVTAPDLGQPGTFSVTLPYTISGRTPARVVVRDTSPAFGGTVHLSSVEITLDP